MGLLWEQKRSSSKIAGSCERCFGLMIHSISTPAADGTGDCLKSGMKSSSSQNCVLRMEIKNSGYFESTTIITPEVAYT